MQHEADVVVVGAGLAGLVAASVLRERGLDVICVEARDRVGGRAHSAAGWIDLGATWYWDGQAAIAETVAALGLSTYPQVLTGDGLLEQPTGDAARLDGNPIDRPAHRLYGGMQAVPRELARRLPTEAVRVSAPVRSIAFERAGAVLVATDTDAFVASAVILAVPPKLAVESIAFTPALPSSIVEAAQAVHTWMSDTVKVVARFEAPYWREAGLAGAALSHVGPFCEFHDHSGPEADQAALFGFAPAARLGGAGANEIAERFQEQVTRLWGAAPLTGIHVADWSSDPFTATSGPARASTAWYHGTPVLRMTHMDGRLVFGSTESAPAFPGYLEGAVLAGRRAAAQVQGVVVDRV